MNSRVLPQSTTRQYNRVKKKLKERSKSAKSLIDEDKRRSKRDSKTTQRERAEMLKDPSKEESLHR